MLPTRHYFANALGSVEYVPGAFVYLRWTDQPVTSSEMRALYVHTRNLLATTQLTCLLADHRAMTSRPSPHDVTWLLTHWLPETMAGTAYMRYAVLPAEGALRLHTSTVLQLMRQLLPVSLFDTLDQATHWLQEADAGYDRQA